MLRFGILVMVLALVVGCGGGYVMTVPDQVVPAGRQAALIAMLQHYEVYKWARPEEGSVLRFSIDDGPMLAAYTDKLGYAGVTMPAPSVDGVYRISVHHMDPDGDEAMGCGWLFVWDPRRAVTAVDLDAVGEEDSSAAEALVRVARDSNIIYLTSDPGWHDMKARRRLERQMLPNGPILLWQREKWRLTQDDRLRTPKLVIDTRMVSPLEQLRELFPTLCRGITASQDSADAFAAAGLTPVVINSPKVKGEVEHLTSWAQLAQ
jgi:hypothetical protein